MNADVALFLAILEALLDGPFAALAETGDPVSSPSETDVSLYAIAAEVIELTRIGRYSEDKLGRMGASTATALTPLLANNEALAAAFEPPARRGFRRVDRRVAASVAASEDVNGRLFVYVPQGAFAPRTDANILIPEPCVHAVA